MKRVVAGGAIVVIALVAGSFLSNFGFVRDLYDSLFHHRTFVATGDVVLKRLQEQKELVAATGTFEVPVVVCNGNPKAYDLKGDADDDGRTPAEQLLEACDGFLDSKATVLASADVDAIIDLSKLSADDIKIDGKRVTVRLPAIELGEPRIDAEDGISVIGKDGSIPIVGGKLPDDYLARAAASAKDAITDVAGGSGLVETGRRSAQSLFSSLLSALGFNHVTVTVKGDSTSASATATPLP